MWPVVSNQEKKNRNWAEGKYLLVLWKRWDFFKDYEFRNFLITRKRIILKTEVTILHDECHRQQIPRQSELSKNLVNMKKVILELDNSALGFLYYSHHSKLWFFIWSSKHKFLVNRFELHFHFLSITIKENPKAQILF